MRLIESIEQLSLKLSEVFSSSRADITTSESLKFVAILGEIELIESPPESCVTALATLRESLTIASRNQSERIRQLCTYTLLDTFNSSLWTLHRKAIQSRSEEHLSVVFQYRVLYEQRLAALKALLLLLSDAERNHVKFNEVLEKIQLLREDLDAFDEELVWNNTLYNDTLETFHWQFADANFWLVKPELWKARVAQCEPRLKWRAQQEKQRYKKFLLSKKSKTLKFSTYVYPSVIKPFTEEELLKQIEQYERAIFNHQTPLHLPEVGGASIYSHLAFLQLEQNQPLKALGSFRKSVMQNLRNRDAWQNLGIGNFHAGTLHRAKFCLEKATTLEPNEYLFNDLGVVYAFLGMREKAKALWSKLLKIESHIEPTYNYATLLISENNTLEAGKLLQWCGEKDKDHGETAFNMAVVMEREAKDFLAERYYTLASKLGVK